MAEEEAFIGIRIDEGAAGEIGSFREDEIHFIDMWVPKKNYQVPRFYTDQGVFTVILTLDACKKAFTTLSSFDSGIIGNYNKISHVVDNGYGLVAHFEGSEHTAILAKNKRRLVKNLIKKGRK